MGCALLRFDDIVFLYLTNSFCILGENALLTELVDFIVAAQTIDHSKEKALNGLIHIDDGKNKVLFSLW